MPRGSVFKPHSIVLFILILSVHPSSLCLSSPPRRVDGVMRTMNTEKLLKTIPIIQNQMDALLDFNVSEAEFEAHRCPSGYFACQQNPLEKPSDMRMFAHRSMPTS